MSWIEALFLGILQGLTEFLPVSSSGHLEIGQALLNKGFEDNLSFAIAVHGATVCSTIVIFFTEIKKLFSESISLKWNESNRFMAMILVSMIPVGIMGIFFRDTIEGLYTGNIHFVGMMLLITALLLSLTLFIKSNQKEISWVSALLIGCMQALAVIPGISRSGATISAALLLGVRKDLATRFSFLMVLPPVIGANLIDLLKHSGETGSAIHPGVLATGFAAAFVAGLFACKVMINIVRKGKLAYFAIYCAVVGLIAILFS
jgi:undecaprenyl-diphosphatase